MSDRTEFEKRNPVPEEAIWSEKKQGYYWSNYPTVAHPFNNDWEVWQEALEYARAQGGQGVEPMVEYSDLQIALINARDTYEGCRNDFPDPKDRRIHKHQCDLISNHIRGLPQFTATQSENEALRAQLKETEAKGRVLMDMCRDLKARVTELSEALQVAVDTPELGGGTWYDMAVAALAERAGGEK